MGRESPSAPPAQGLQLLARKPQPAKRLPAPGRWCRGDGERWSSQSPGLGNQDDLRPAALPALCWVQGQAPHSPAASGTVTLPFPAAPLLTPRSPDPRAEPSWELRDTSPRSAASSIPSPCQPGRVVLVLTHHVPALCPTGLSQPPAHMLCLGIGGQKPPSTSRFPARAASPLKTQTHRTPPKTLQQQAWLCPGTTTVPDRLAPLKSLPRLFTWRTTAPRAQLKQTPSNTRVFQL